MTIVAKLPEGCGICPTRNVCAARDLPASSLDDFASCFTTTNPMNKGDYLYRVDDSADAWFVIRSGVYKTIMVTTDGEEYITGFFYPGEILGLSGAASGRFDETAMALTSGTACSIATGDLPKLWALDADRAILRLIAERDRTETRLRINLSQSKAEVRIAGFIRLLMERTERLGFDPRCLAMPMSRTDLANHLGLTLECLSRVLSKWRKAGVIESDRSTMQILKPEELATTAYHLAA
jgi:CRP/FNR family transcriptional regulator